MSRNNGIVFDVRENVPISTYVNEMAKTLPPETILYASRIAGNRVAMYFNDRKHAQEAVTQGMVVNNSLISISPLVRQTTRLVFSNVYPEIPDHILEENISDFCNIVSPIRSIPIGMKENLAHVLSFRRQVHVFIEPNINIPGHINIAYGGGNYRVFLSTDFVKCFACGEHGHTRRNCKKQKTAASDDSEDDGSQDENPINPKPIFMHRNKSDPKHPPKSSRNRQNQATDDNEEPKAHDEAGVRPPSSPPSPTQPSAPTQPSTKPNPKPSPIPPIPRPLNSNHTNPPSPSQPPTPSPNPDPPTTPASVTPPIPKATDQSAFVSIWGSPPGPSRETFSEVLRKRKKKTPSPPSQGLTKLKSDSPPKKTLKPPNDDLTDTPSLTQALDGDDDNASDVSHQSQLPPDATQESVDMSDTETDDTASILSETNSQPSELECEEGDLSIPTGPLSQKQMTAFLKCVKARRKPGEIAKKFTGDIPGLVKQLKPLRSSPLLNRNMQMRIRKLVKGLDIEDVSRLIPK